MLLDLASHGVYHHDMACEGSLLDLGTRGYAEAWQLQKEVWQLRVDRQIPDTLILVEHPHVITLGRSGRIGNLLVSEEELNRQGVGLFRVERGGDITYHGPGQLVGYPVFLLKDALAGVRRFVNRLEQSLIQALQVWDIRAGTRPKLTGVWVGADKVAALGITVKRRVTFHGFALNVNTDLSYFRLVNPCGIRDQGVTSISQLLGRDMPMSVVKHQVCASFQDVFDIGFRPFPANAETRELRSERRSSGDF